MKEIITINDAKKVIRDSSSCRVSTKLWKEMLLKNEDTVVIKATLFCIIGKNLGAGVYELKAIRKKGAISQNKC